MLDRLPATVRAGALAVMSAALLAAASTPADADTGRVVHARGPLADLRPAVSDPTDGASAHVVSARRAPGTAVVFQVRGLDAAEAGRTLGAHVHEGPCVPGDGAAAGPHYNAEKEAGVAAYEISPRTEVWLDITIGPAGNATAVAHVPFHVIPGEAASVVVHALPTDHAGAAGARLACLPVDF